MRLLEGFIINFFVNAKLQSCRCYVKSEVCEKCDCVMKNRVEMATAKAELIHLFVGLPSDDVCSLRDIRTDLLIHQVKSKIELRVGIPGDLIHLFFMNNELADSKTLQEYKLKHGCILRVRLHKTWLGLFLACAKGDAYQVFQNGVQMMGDENSNDFDVELWNKLVIKRASFALFMATYHGYLSLMLELLNSSAADINGCTVFGRTSLHIAAFQGFVGCVSLLVSEGALSNVADVFGKTPMQLANVNKHVYCQKRLYMHQVSRDEETYPKASDVSVRRPKTAPAPHEILKSLQQNKRTKRSKVMSNYTKTRKDASKSSESLPSITIPSKDNLITSNNHTHPSPSYDFPLMKIVKPLKQNASEREISSPQTSIMRAQTAPIRREASVNSSQSSASRGIRGIDAILRTSQDDVVGEYHNIEESLADVNMTTLKLSLAQEETKDSETTQPEVDTYGENNFPETRAQSPTNKKLIGFVLRAEENRRVEQEKQNDGYSESGKQGEKQKTSADENQTLDERYDTSVWTPITYDSFVKSTSPHKKLGSSLSYDEWLEKKRQSAKEARDNRPASATHLRSKVGREIDVESFQKWLEGKRKGRRRSKPETSMEHHRLGCGVSFEAWLRQKRQLGGGNVKTMSDYFEDSESGKVDPRPKGTNLCGKSFSEWLAEKRQPHESDETVNMKQKRNRSQSGKTFQEWLRDKNKDKQKEADLQDRLELLEMQKKALFDEKRKLNPRVKTFEQWFEEKRSQSVIELVQSKNVPAGSELLNSRIKFPEDACLVFDMWLMSKHAEELRKEEKLYEEMVEKWRRKEQQRLQIRRSILSKLSQEKKDK